MFSSAMPSPAHRATTLLLALALAMGALLPLAAPARTRGATELFFSEYIEGSSNNKALEIYNGTGAPVNVVDGGYNVQMFFNGSASAGLTINLDGGSSDVVADRDVFVLAQSSASATILAQADQTNGSGWFNGDDAVVLRKGTTVIDVVGQIGLDPGTEWGTGLASTADNTLRRKPDASAGDTDGADAFDPSAGWNGFATDTFDGLGSHAVAGERTNPTGTGAAAPSTVEQGATTLLTVTVAPGSNPPSTDVTVTADLSSIGGATGQPFFDDASNGDVATGDNVFSYRALVPAATAVGPKQLPARIEDGEDRQGEATINLTVIAPPEPTEIWEIQGAGHRSPLVGQDVFRVEGVVTAVRPSSFYMTDPTPDADDATSDGILVFRGSAPGVAVGDLVLVSGRVTEFRPGGASTANLSTTELVNPSATNPISVQVVSHDNALPVVVVGDGGRVPPSDIIDDDAVGGSVENSGGIFDPATDGIDFWESLEGQYLRINDAIAVGPTNGFGEIPVVGDGRSHAGVQTPRGGIVIGPNDFNPERVLVDDAITPTPDVNVGDGFTTPVLGVLDYDFGNFKLLATTPLVRQDNGLIRETTAAADRRELSIATFNVENLDPNPADGDDDDVARLGALIAQNMQAPDILAIEEIQDNNGTINDGTVAADLTWTSLIAAIRTAGGPVYEYRQIDPVNNDEGGAPGGNIRVGFLFRPDRGVTFVDRPGGSSRVDTEVVVVGEDRPRLTFSPGRIGTDAPAFNDTRKSLAGEFVWRDQTVFVIANHFSSKGGDQPLFGRFQPPVRVSEFASPSEATDSDGWRHGQAAEINDFVDRILAIDRKANVVVLGDVNDFQFSETVDILTGADAGEPVLTTLFDLLPAGEQYSYVFDGNAQVLDQILVSRAILRQSPTYDVVRVNAEFFDQASDHDPSVMRVMLSRGERTRGDGGGG